MHTLSSYNKSYFLYTEYFDYEQQTSKKKQHYNRLDFRVHWRALHNNNIIKFTIQL